MIARLLRELAALFVVTGPGSSPERLGGPRTGWLLMCIVLAGAVVRFWGLGDVGLHGDEKTMALPVMGLVNQGLPLMPSGMIYPRAVAQLYLMAASVMAFGQSEWALRLPSALCGILLIVLTWQVGKRYLTPLWNLSLAAAVAFLPSFIDDAQTARMYVFLVTSVAGYMALVFAWERTGRVGYLVGAVVTLLVGIQFHTLAIFAAFLVFLPGLTQGDSRKLWSGVAAFATLALGFEIINHLIALAYPQNVDTDGDAVGGNGPHAAIVPHVKHLWLLLGACPALAFSIWVVTGAQRRKSRQPKRSEGNPKKRQWRDVGEAPGARRGSRGIVAPLLLCAALVAEVGFQWHAALMLTAVALVFARRVGPMSPARLVSFFGVSVAIGTAQALFLLHQHAGSLKQIAGVLLGWPSVWSFISIGGYSEVAMLAVVGSLAAGLWVLAHRKPVPDHLLLVVLGVWIPLLMIGWIKWNIPSRYAAAQIMPLLVAAFAALQWLAQSVARPRIAAGGLTPAWIPAAAVLAVILVVNPVQVARAVDSGYTNHPDHKGAAEFVARLHPGPHDIIIAEDVLQQTYYLGHVDYWLQNKQVAMPFMHRVHGRWLDFYTGTPLIGSGSELEQLAERTDRGAIYVIGSGENQEDGRRLMRALGIAQALDSPPFRSVYVGRDGVTHVWKVDAPLPSVAKGQ